MSSNKAIFLAAIENLKNASNNFGPALNKHLPMALQMIKKKQDLASIERIHDLKHILVTNGGPEAEKIVMSAQLKWVNIYKLFKLILRINYTIFNNYSMILFISTDKFWIVLPFATAACYTPLF